jgi:hypothetical protein
VRILDEMACLAGWMFHDGLTPQTRKRLEQIRDASPLYGAEPETAAVE